MDELQRAVLAVMRSAAPSAADYCKVQRLLHVHTVRLREPFEKKLRAIKNEKTGG